MPYIDNYNTALPVKTDPGDLVRQWFFSIWVQDEREENHLLYPLIFSSFVYRKGEKVQAVTGFNEVTHLYAFGKQPDSLQLNGHILSMTLQNPAFLLSSYLCTSSFDRILRAFNAAQYGIRTRVAGPSIGGQGRTIIKGVATDMTISMNGAINSVMDFSMNFLSVDTSMSFGGGSVAAPDVPTTGRAILEPFGL